MGRVDASLEEEHEALEAFWDEEELDWATLLIMLLISCSF